VNAPPDGYTLLLANLANAINATLYDKLNFNFIRDIAPVAGISQAPLIMVVNPSVPAKSVSEFIAYAKANPGRINMGSAGIGSAGHLAGELFKMMAGVSLVHVPYRARRARSRPPTPLPGRRRHNTAPTSPSRRHPQPDTRRAREARGRGQFPPGVEGSCCAVAAGCAAVGTTVSGSFSAMEINPLRIRSISAIRRSSRAGVSGA
jgi:Tripartite tricarboxylate transporter family receptor